MNQQCWLWGQDIRHPDGNLLLRHGFERTRPPEGITGSSQYSLRLDMRLIVRLWGFGIAYGTDESKIYINRYEFSPRLLTEVGDHWEPPGANLFATDTVTLEAALRWIGRYELQVERELGDRYRQELILKWGKGRKLDRPLNECWSMLAEQLADARNQRHLVRRL